MPPVLEDSFGSFRLNSALIVWHIALNALMGHPAYPAHKDIIGIQVITAFGYFSLARSECIAPA